MRTGTCVRCGEAFEDRSRAQGRKYCSDKCRKYDWAEANRPVCSSCGERISQRAKRCFECDMQVREEARLERYTRIKELWDAGIPLKDIGPQVGRANTNALSVEMARMKHAGWELSPRRKGWTGDYEWVGGTRRPPRTHQHVSQRLGYAVRQGKIERPDKCERCGRDGYVDGHHPDYSKPLEVEWLCRSCHSAHHVAERQAA